VHQALLKLPLCTINMSLDDDSILIQKSNSQLLAPVSLVFRYTILKHIHTH